MSAINRQMLMKPSPELGSTVLFLGGGTEYTVDDAVAWAIFHGSLDRAIRETLVAAAAARRADDEGFAPDDEELQEASEKFRYQRDLISAGETEEWLEARGLTMEDFSDWFHQQLSAQTFNDLEEDSDVPEDFPELLRVHLWMSDRMEELTTEFSRRIAAGLELSERRDSLTEPVMKRFLNQHGLNEAGLAGWLEALGRDRSWLSDTVRDEAAFDRLASSAATAEARSRALAPMRLSLTRVEIETLELDSEAAAREAFLCVRDDGISLADLARDAGYRSERVGMWMDSVDDTLAPRLLGAGEGDVVGPIPWHGRFKVCHVLRKLAPAVSDPAVCHRLDKIIIDQSFADLCARHVQVPAHLPIQK